MEKEEFFLKLDNNMKKINIQLNDEQKNQFYIYMKLLLEWNEMINLTAITEPIDVIKKHFVDSATILKYIEEKSSIVDVGTGAGFPGIPLKILKPNTKILLVDSLNKRISFLDEVINKLELKGIETKHSRAEDLGRNPNYREKFDIVTSRAVSNMATLSEYMLPLVKIKGSMICMKGSNISDELEDSKKAIQVLGGKLKIVDEFNFLNEDIDRSIVIIDKINKTPKIYPRKAGTPLKSPIK